MLLFFIFSSQLQEIKSGIYGYEPGKSTIALASTNKEAEGFLKKLSEKILNSYDLQLYLYRVTGFTPLNGEDKNGLLISYEMDGGTYKAFLPKIQKPEDLKFEDLHALHAALHQYRPPKRDYTQEEKLCADNETDIKNTDEASKGKKRVLKYIETSDLKGIIFILKQIEKQNPNLCLVILKNLKDRLNPIKQKSHSTETTLWYLPSFYDQKDSDGKTVEELYCGLLDEIELASTSKKIEIFNRGSSGNSCVALSLTDMPGSLPNEIAPFPDMLRSNDMKFNGPKFARRLEKLSRENPNLAGIVWNYLVLKEAPPFSGKILEEISSVFKTPKDFKISEKILQRPSTINDDNLERCLFIKILFAANNSSNQEKEAKKVNAKKEIEEFQRELSLLKTKKSNGEPLSEENKERISYLEGADPAVRSEIERELSLLKTKKSKGEPLSEEDKEKITVLNAKDIAAHGKIERLQIAFKMDHGGKSRLPTSDSSTWYSPVEPLGEMSLLGYCYLREKSKSDYERPDGAAYLARYRKDKRHAPSDGILMYENPDDPSNPVAAIGHAKAVRLL